jgi:hypothetical protein
MTSGAGAVHRQTGGCGYFARVRLKVDLEADQPYIRFGCNGEGWTGQGNIETASAEGYEPWKLGAREGVVHAMEYCGRRDLGVEIVSITGMGSDTNAMLVGIAAAFALWNALGIEASDEERRHLDELLLGSWKSERWDFF